MDLHDQMIVDVIIPAFNEENAVGRVIADLPKSLIRHIVVCNNNSKDDTKRRAETAGAIVLDEPKQGYGAACLKGLSYLKTLTPAPDIVAFIDADYSDHPEELPILLAPIINDGQDMVIGSRALGQVEKQAMTKTQIFGNWLATSLIRLLYGYEFTDLGPFRTIRYEALLQLNMQDQTYGWTVEMQVKAAKLKLKCCERPVTYRKRIGQSKISGTIKGVFLAGQKILWTIFKLI